MLRNMILLAYVSNRGPWSAGGGAQLGNARVQVQVQLGLALDHDT